MKNIPILVKANKGHLIPGWPPGSKVIKSSRILEVVKSSKLGLWHKVVKYLLPSQFSKF